MATKLSDYQREVLEQMPDYPAWISYYKLQTWRKRRQSAWHKRHGMDPGRVKASVSINTMRALVTKGYVERDGYAFRKIKEPSDG